MNLADIVVWFATRRCRPITAKFVIASLGDVRSRLIQLEEMGILGRCYMGRNGRLGFALKNWHMYQARKKVAA